MTLLHVFTQEHLLGRTWTWIKRPIGTHTILAVPRLRLEHYPTLMFAEGASLLRVFDGSFCDLGRASVLSGRFEMFARSTPTLSDVIVFVPDSSGGDTPTLGEMIRVGAAALRGE